MIEESYTPDGVLLTWKGGTQAVQACREEFIKLLRQWREREDERETCEKLRKALPEKFP